MTTEMTTAERKWINNASYEDLLRRWRFAPSGDEMFNGESGLYYARIMREKKEKCDHVKASKNIGWNNSND